MTVFTMFYSHSYLLYSYSHPWNVKNSITFSQFLRLRRLCSYEPNFSDELDAMKDWEGIHLLLFATRTLWEDLLGYFKIIFYLAVLSVNLLQYVSDFALSLLEHVS